MISLVNDTRTQTNRLYCRRFVAVCFTLFTLMLLGCGSGGESSSENSSETNPGSPNSTITMPPLKTTTWQLLDANHGIEGSAWQLAQCDACHLMADIHQQPQQLNIQAMVKDKGYQSCIGCHGDNGTEQQRPCLVCHNNHDLEQTPKHSGKLSHNFIANFSQNNANETSSTVSENTLTDQQCLDCHIASDMNGTFDINIDLTRFIDEHQQQTAYQDSSDFCLRCHNQNNQQQGFEIENKDYQNPLVAMKTNYQHIDFHGAVNGIGKRTYSGLREGYQYQSKVQCIDCHAMHGTHNEKLIIGNAQMGAYQLSHTTLGQSLPQDMPLTRNKAQRLSIEVTTTQGDSSQLCVLCHQMSEILDDGYKDTGNGLSGVHYTGQECRSCHQHGMATQTGL